MTAILHDEPPDLADSGKNLPPELAQVIGHCLEKNPEERFQSARDLAFALRAILSGSDLSKTAPHARAAATTMTPRPQRRRRSKTIDSLAVLPLANAGGDANAEYLSDGITESLIYSLSQLPKLRVMARSTVFRYKGKPVDPQEVGRELNVRAVLTGRVVVLGERLVIKTELVDAADGALLWGEQYARPLADILAVQEEISTDITDKLRLKLTGKEKKQLAKRHTDNTQAYHLYLKGRFHWNKRTPDSFRKGIEYFLAAIAKDPAYALAHAGLADCYNMLGAYGALPPREAYPKAEAAARKALEIDDTLAEAHTSLAWVQAGFVWDWPGAERAFQKALRLNPGYATAHHWYAYCLMKLGRLPEAEAEMQRAQELDPLAPIITANVGFGWYFAGRLDAALEQFRKALETDAHFAVAHYYLGLAYEAKGMFPEAVAGFQQAIALSEGNTEYIAGLGHAYAAAGRTEEARKVVDDLVQQGQRKYVPPFHLGLVWAGLGDTDQAFAWLAKAYEERDDYLTYLKADPRLKGLRSDPRYVSLCQHVGLPV
jgi:TolB-like protein/Tfp pilus assembly protein PilF